MANDLATRTEEKHRNKIAIAAEKFGALHRVAAKRAAILDKVFQMAPLNGDASLERIRKRVAELPSVATLEAEHEALAAAVAPQPTNEAAARWLVAALAGGMGVQITPDRIDFLVQLLKEADAENTEDGAEEGFSPQVLYTAIMRVAATAEYGLKPADLVKAATAARTTYQTALSATKEALIHAKIAERLLREEERLNPVCDDDEEDVGGASGVVYDDQGEAATSKFDDNLPF